MNLAEIAKEYHQQLLDSEQGMQWWRERGFTLDTIRNFLFGYIEFPLSTEDAKYKNCPTIPYLTTNPEKAITLRVRTSGNAKYMPIYREFPLPQPRTHLFNAKQALPTSRQSKVYICEGELDAAAVWQAGGKAVGVPGATSWQPHWGYLLREAEVVIAMDADDAGQRGADRLEKELREYRVLPERAALPEGLDVCDILSTEGTEGVQMALGL